MNYHSDCGLSTAPKNCMVYNVPLDVSNIHTCRRPVDGHHKMSILTIETRAGKVQGKKENATDGSEFYSFKGIPYAKPPIGDLRFADPEPPESWTGIRETISHGPNCAHSDYFTKEVVGSDDCLYLNVYARCISPEKNWPVMVFIHGGGFVDGSGDESLYGPDFFMCKDVVLVTLNYRLGVLGFLNLDDEAAPGNQGLKDQIMALKWVHDNISNFGGDLNNVTIFGQSAGGASVHYLCLSPLATGLFQKAILQSGVALNPWAYQSNIKDKAYRLCKQLGHNNNDPKSIVQFLRTIDAKKLIEAQEQIQTKEEKIQSEYSFGPSIDSKSKNPLIAAKPEEIAANGIKIPLLIGYTNREGICYLNEYLEYLNKSTLNINEIVPAGLKDVLKKYYNLTPEDLNHIYFNDQPITNQSLEKLADFAGDLHFLEGIQRVIKNQISKKYAPTYVYQFTYDKGPSVFKMISKVQMSGAAHEDELVHLFKRRSLNDNIEFVKNDSEKYKITKQMIELWVNFATTGKPTPKSSGLVPVNWQPVDDKSGLRYLNICENLRMEVVPDIGQQYAARKYPKNIA